MSSNKEDAAGVIIGLYFLFACVITVLFTILKFCEVFKYSWWFVFTFFYPLIVIIAFGWIINLLFGSRGNDG